jgi:hypothetical protein
MSIRRRSARLEHKGNEEHPSDGSDTSVQGDQPHPLGTGNFDYSDLSTVAHVLNPDIGFTRLEVAPAGHVTVPDSPQLEAEPQCDDAPPTHDSFPRHGQQRDHQAHVSQLSGDLHANQQLAYTPVVARRHLPFEDTHGATAPAQSQMRTANDRSFDGSSLAAMLTATYTPEVLRSMMNTLAGNDDRTSTHSPSGTRPFTVAPISASNAPTTVLRHPQREVIVISPSPSPGGSPVRTETCLPAQAQGRKRDTPGNPSASSGSNSADSGGQAPGSSSELVGQQVTARQGAVLSPRAARRATGGGTRCPICLINLAEAAPTHNPYNCVRIDGTRSVLEDQQCVAIAASRRVLHDMGLATQLNPNYAIPEDDAEEEVAACTRHTSRTVTSGPRQQSMHRYIDPRIQSVREDERAAYAAGVDAVVSESRSRDSSVHGSGSGSQYSSSSYAPSRSTSSSESAPPAWAIAMSARLEQVSTTLASVINTQNRHNEMFERNVAHPPFCWPQPPYMPPGFIPMAPYMPNSMGPQMPDRSGPPHMQDGSFLAPRHLPSEDDSVQPRLHPMQFERHSSGVTFQDQLGTASPSMLHTARPRGGMRGAPELSPEDIGNVGKFNEFLQKHASYAAAAREQGQSWATVAGLLSRYADDLAVAFNACALKRHGQATFDSHAVLQLSDDTFERLYLEACAPTVEYPSQVLEHLEVVPFIRQQQHESSPMPAILRAAEAFRVQLRLLPARAVSECKEEALAMAFMTLLFGQAAKHRPNDFQRCNTWTDLKNALIQCAASTPTWFGTALLDPATQPSAEKPKPSLSVGSASSSTTSTTGDTKKVAERVAKLRESGELKDIETDGLSDKQILKAHNKARWRAKIGEQAVETAKLGNAALLARLDEQQKLLASLTQQVKSRGESRERYDRQREEWHRGERSHDDRQRPDARPRSQDTDAPQNGSAANAGRGQQPASTNQGGQRQPSPGPRRNDSRPGA